MIFPFPSSNFSPIISYLPSGTRFILPVLSSFTFPPFLLFFFFFPKFLFLFQYFPFPILSSLFLSPFRVYFSILPFIHFLLSFNFPSSYPFSYIPQFSLYSWTSRKRRPKMQRLSGRLREVVAYKNRITGNLFREVVWAYLLYGR